MYYQIFRRFFLQCTQKTGRIPTGKETMGKGRQGDGIAGRPLPVRQPLTVGGWEAETRRDASC